MERVAHIIICKINSQWEFAVWQINQGLCINLDWWDGEEGSKRRDTCIPMADSC